MSYLNQKTINSPVSFEGVGLHSGKIVNISIKPAQPNSCIFFKSVDLNLNNIVYPNFNNVSHPSFHTTISH